jgi:hypothetical protein
MLDSRAFLKEPALVMHQHRLEEEEGEKKGILDTNDDEESLLLQQHQSGVDTLDGSRHGASSASGAYIDALAHIPSVLVEGQRSSPSRSSSSSLSSDGLSPPRMQSANGLRAGGGGAYNHSSSGISEQQIIVNPIKDLLVYDAIGSNSVVEASPAVLHFSHFDALRRVYTQTLRVINVSQKRSIRVHILPPDTPFFTIRSALPHGTSKKTQSGENQQQHQPGLVQRKGLLAPGMSEEIIVEFTPHEFRYHSDAVKVGLVLFVVPLPLSDCYCACF